MTGATAPVSEEIDFDPARLRAYLAHVRPELEGEMGVERVGGGQSNPTYFLTFDTGEVVLRKRPVGDLVASAHDVGREFRLLRAVGPTGLPVPEALLFCDDPTVIGTPFYLMERLHGRIFHDASMPTVERDDRRAIYAGHARAMAALHAIDWQAAGLGDLARPGSFLSRQTERWIRAWGSDRPADVQRVASWLKVHRPPQERAALVHGDFKFTNVVFDPSRPVLIGVLDWELAAIGDPLLDVAHVWSALWATRPDEYGGLMGADLDELGLPDAAEYLAEYNAAAGGAPMAPFHQVLALLRNAGIFRGIGERAVTGTANAANASTAGRLADVYLDRALGWLEQAG
jgi:aminoglycoside phosphotransferase (APT) family kinase protein